MNSDPVRAILDKMGKEYIKPECGTVEDHFIRAIDKAFKAEYERVILFGESDEECK